MAWCYTSGPNQIWGQMSSVDLVYFANLLLFSTQSRTSIDIIRENAK